LKCDSLVIKRSPKQQFQQSLIDEQDVYRLIPPDIASIEGLLSSLVDFFLLAQPYVQVKAGSNWINGSGFSIGASQLCAIPGGQRIDGRENCTPEDKLVPS